MSNEASTRETKPASRHHTYPARIRWTGNLGTGTSGYRAYSRDHEISAPGKPTLPGSADSAFRGDAARYNPEDLLVASVSSCHMLWYLHLCADAGIILLEYEDDAVGTMVETRGTGGRFTEILLRPACVIALGGDPERAAALHTRAHELCFVANSVNFPVRCEPTVTVAPTGGP